MALRFARICRFVARPTPSIRGTSLRPDRFRFRVGAGRGLDSQRPHWNRCPQACRPYSTQPHIVPEKMGAIGTAMVDTTARVAHLRALMAKNDVQAYVIPSEDAHASEYPADSDLRRCFITGFTGSAGTAIVTTIPPVATASAKEKGEAEALLFTDGRYFLQAGQQLQPTIWKLMRQGEEGVPTWTGESNHYGVVQGRSADNFRPDLARVFEQLLTLGDVYRY